MATQTESKSILKQFIVLERAVTYSRVSGDDSKKDNIKGQLDMSREHCQQKGYQIVDEMFEDPKKHTSGYDIDLPVLNQIREMAHAGQFDVLVVRELDRLSRSLAKQLIVEEELKRAGVRVEYVLESYADSPEGRLQKHIKATVAEYEREKIRERMMRGRLDKVKRGFVIPHGKGAPFGYCKTKVDAGWHFEIVEAEAAIVRLCFQWYTLGDESGRTLSLGKIADKFNGMGIPASKGRSWKRATVRAIIRNETYCGTWHYSKIPVTVPAIIEREVWEAAQERTQYNKEHSQRNRKPGRYLLATRLTCGDCHHKMFGITKQAKDETCGYYICHNRHAISRERLCSCNLPRFDSQLVDALVWGRLEEVANDREKLLAGLHGYQHQQEGKVNLIRQELISVELLIADKKSEWESAYLDQKLLKSERAKARKAIEIEEIEKLLDELEKRKAKLMAQLEDKSLTDEQIAGIVRFALQVARAMKTLRQAEKSGIATPELRLKVFNLKCQLLELLDVQITLFVQDNKKKGRIIAKFCPVQDEDFIIELGNTCITKLNQPTWVIFSDVIVL